MMPVATAAEVRELDRRVIEEIGVPGMALMETAARGVALAVRAHHLDEARRGVVVVCGGGNNGGDGWACARWLFGWGLPVQVLSLADRLAGDAAAQRDVCRRMGVPERDVLGDAGLIVDAVFGTGLSRTVEGRYAEAIASMAEHGAPVVAIDLPSGLHADTGAVLGVVAPAARTVTFGRLKQGLVAGSGPDVCGVIELVDIGLDAAGAPWHAEVPDAADLAPLWPRRAPSDHKGRSGHLLVVAGSAAMTGAAVLCVRGALAAGAGLVTLVAPRGAAPRLAALPAAAMVVWAGEGDTVERVPEAALARATALLAGPGLGGGGPLPAADALARLWRDSPLPVVYDADALAVVEPTHRPRVITPHPAEAARLLDATTAEVQLDRFAAARALAADGAVSLLKGRYTLVASAGDPVSVNPTGAATLATGGSGDVLAGVVGGLLARGCSPRDAARLGAWVHGVAGELLAARRVEGWTSDDVATEIPAAVAHLLDHGAAASS